MKENAGKFLDIVTIGTMWWAGMGGIALPVREELEEFIHKYEEGVEGWEGGTQRDFTVDGICACVGREHVSERTVYVKRIFLERKSAGFSYILIIQALKFLFGMILEINSSSF